MKARILFTVLMIAMIMGTMAQKPAMVLTFTADSNGQHVPLNSILIENLTQGVDTTLYAPDTVLVLNYNITGMNENFVFDDNSFTLFQNYPNPMRGKTTVSLYLPEKENMLIIVSDVIGREMVNKEFHLERGNHSFTFYPGRESLYFLTTWIDQQSRTIKMFNSPSNANASGVCKLEYNGQQKTGAVDYKSGNALNTFVFDLGNKLKFTSFTDQGERVISHSPTFNKTYHFNYTGEPCPGIPTVTDIDSNVYNTVQIGTQCWMKENLKTTTYRNGIAIPYVADEIAWSNVNTGAYVWNYYIMDYKDDYGALYNGYAIVDPSGLCPTGWHVPTNEEWIVLIDYLGGLNVAGGKLKSTRTYPEPQPRWEYPNTAATDEVGFSGLPGGLRNYDGQFYTFEEDGRWWSTTERWPGSLWTYILNSHTGGARMVNFMVTCGFSVRCLRD